MSDTIDDGGPAFPVSLPGMGDNGACGMPLRDYFAAKAMQALLGSPLLNSVDIDVLTKESYMTADAMLKARQS